MYVWEVRQYQSLSKTGLVTGVVDYTDNIALIQYWAVCY